MNELFDKSLRDVLKASASKQPVPGGGSVAAISLAFAASMAAMVANLTLGKKKYRDVESQMTALRDRAVCLMNKAEELVLADMNRFQRLMERYRMPAETEEEKAKKGSLIQEALKGATETPLDIAGACLEVLEIVREMAPIGNKMAISDAGVAAYLADASLGAALLNVDINVPQITDRAFAEKALGEKERLIREAGDLKSQSLATVSSRLGS